MDRYQRVEKPKPEVAINENEIRITTQGLIRNYISYATSLLQEKKAPEIVLKAMGQAISKTVTTAEIIKRKVPGLYQNTELSSTSITDAWEPIEEGLLPVETTRHVSVIAITLSTKPLDENAIGYQEPLPDDQVKPQKSVFSDGDSRGGRARGRGTGRGRFRGRGWGISGRGFGRGRGHAWGYGRASGRDPGNVTHEIEV